MEVFESEVLGEGVVVLTQDSGQMLLSELFVRGTVQEIPEISEG